MMGTHIRKRAGAKAVSAMLVAMFVRPQTYANLVALTGLSQPTISAWIREMRHARLVMVGRWDADSRGFQTIPAFQWSPFCSDMPRPAKPAAQRMAEMRVRKNGGAS